jgi:hypothetical protein
MFGACWAFWFWFWMMIGFGIDTPLCAGAS